MPVELSIYEAAAVVEALERGVTASNGRTPPNETEMKRALESAREWKAHGLLFQAIVGGECDVRFKQRGAGCAEIMRRTE